MEPKYQTITNGSLPNYAGHTQSQDLLKQRGEMNSALRSINNVFPDCVNNKLGITNSEVDVTKRREEREVTERPNPLRPTVVDKYIKSVLDIGAN